MHICARTCTYIHRHLQLALCMSYCLSLNGLVHTQVEIPLIHEIASVGAIVTAGAHAACQLRMCTFARLEMSPRYMLICLVADAFLNITTMLMPTWIHSDNVCCWILIHAWEHCAIIWLLCEAVLRVFVFFMLHESIRVFHASYGKFCFSSVSSHVDVHDFLRNGWHACMSMPKQ